MLLRLQKLAADWVNLLAVCLTAALIGGIVAIFEGVFYLGLKYSISFHEAHRIVLTCLLPVIGAGMVWVFKKYGGLSCKGMNLVFEVSQGLTPRIPKRTLFFVTVCTWISHLAGASVGREGVAVQIGATVSDLVRNLLPFYHKARTNFLVVGIAAGFAGLFGTPFTAAFFAIEVFTAGKLELASLLPAMVAAFCSCKTAEMFGIHPEVHPIQSSEVFGTITIGWKLVALGLIFGMIGGIFAYLIHQGKDLAAKWFPDPVKRIFWLGIPTAILIILLFQGRYSNTGSELMEMSLNNEGIMPWDFAGKMLITICSLAIGFIGGEVTPLFTTGATLGCVLGPVFHLNPCLCAALGYAAVFGAGTNTWLAAIMIGMELFGYHWFPFFFVVCSVAFVINQNQSIYSMQRVLYEQDLKPLRLYYPKPLAALSEGTKTRLHKPEHIVRSSKSDQTGEDCGAQAENSTQDRSNSS